MKDRQNNGQKIPRGNKKGTSMKVRENNGQKIPRGNKKAYPSLIYTFLLHLGIFCPLFCLSFYELRLLITPWYLCPKKA
jgi:hypothetical protein